MLKVGDIIAVEIAGTEIGNAVVSEVTEDYIEVVYMGRAYKLGPNVLDYMEARRLVENL